VVSDATIREAGQLLADAASSPARVLLIGSHAWGTPHDRSDIDFLVIEQQVDRKVREMAHLRDALPPLGVPVDVLVVSEAEAATRGKNPSTLIHRALTHGVLIGQSGDPANRAQSATPE